MSDEEKGVLENISRERWDAMTGGIGAPYGARLDGYVPPEADAAADSEGKVKDSENTGDSTGSESDARRGDVDSNQGSAKPEGATGETATSGEPEGELSPLEIQMKKVQEANEAKAKLEAENATKDKQVRDAKSELTPLFQENAELRKQNALFEAKLAELEAKVKAKGEEYDYDPDDDELATIKPHLEERERKMKEEVEALVAPQREELEKLKAEQERKAHLDNHYNVVHAAHPDINDFIGEGKYGLTFEDWINSKPKFVAENFSVDKDPAYMVSILNDFKAAYPNSKPKAKIAPADVAPPNPQGANSRQYTPNGVAVENLLSNKEMDNIQYLLARAATPGNEAEYERLVNGYLATGKAKGLI